MRTSTLASWIDSEAVASLAMDLCPPEEEDFGDGRAGGWVGALGATVAVADYPGEEDVSRARAKLEAIRAQARHSGLIDHAVEVVEAEVPGKIVPGGAEAEVADEGAIAVPEAEAEEVLKEMGEAMEFGDGSCGEGPFQEKRSIGAVVEERVPVAKKEEERAYVIPHGTLGVRMGSYAAWVSEVVGGGDVFVIDGQGYPLVERGGDSDLVAAALLLGDAARRASGQVEGGEGVVRMEVGGGMVLSVLACETQYGTLCVCVHGREPVGREAGGRLSAALRVTLGV